MTAEETAGALGAQDDEARLRFVEQFGLLLHQSGIPRMPARVFAYVLAADVEVHTAGELATGLRVSPASISGAVRYLVRIGLLARERAPGKRVDHYRVYDDDVWSAITLQELPMFERTVAFLAKQVELLDPSRPGGRRVRETLEFYRFLQAEMPAVVERWKKHRAQCDFGGVRGGVRGAG